MQNEIQEILDRCTPYLFGDEVDKLVNYITNLQEEKAHYYCLYKGYKSIKDKAVEYINKNKHLSMFADCREPEEEWLYDLECDANDLLNILQGDDKE